jgi:hypothetical protein
MSSVHIPQTEAEQYYAIKDMMASNLCSKGVFALPTESLAKLTSKILNINTACIVRFYQGGTITTSNTSAASTSSASITLTPPSATLNWGGEIGSRTSPAMDFRLVSATIRTSWYGSANYGNYTSVHFIQLVSNSSILDPTQWDGNWSYNVFNRPYYNSYPDTSNNNTSQTAGRGAATFTLAPYSNSTTYNYWNPNYLNLAQCNWVVKRPV